MESAASCTSSTAPAAAATSLQSLDTSSRAPSSAEKVKEMIAEFKCEYCPRTFRSARGRGGHRKVHKNQRQIRKNKNQKEHRRLAPAGPQVRLSSSLLPVPGLPSAYFDFHAQLFNSHYFPSSARSGVVPLFAGTGTGGLALAQPSSAANGSTGGGGQVGSGGHLGRLRKVNQGETAHGTHNFPSLRSSTMPMFLSQTASGTSGLAQPSLATPAPAADVNGGTGDGVHLGLQQDMPDVKQKETADGIDLTLRL